MFMLLFALASISSYVYVITDASFANSAIDVCTQPKGYLYMKTCEAVQNKMFIVIQHVFLSEATNNIQLYNEMRL